MIKIAAPYHMPTGNVSNFIDMFGYMNSLTPETGLFGMLLLVAIFVITFTMNADKEVEVAFAISSWLTFLSAATLSVMTGAYGYLIPGNYVTITLSLAIVSVIMLYMRR